jgi:tetratricopeptide (TPR) repeat protein
LINEVNQRARHLGHAPSMAHPLNWPSRLEILRGDAVAALSAAEELEALCREHGMPLWRVNAELKVGWARGRLHDAAAGAEDLRRALAAAADLGMMRDAWFYTALLAELEAQTLGADSALARINEALVLAHQIDDRCDLPFPHLLRGELLLKRNPSNPAPAEEAFRAALDVAREQGARSWGLRAALSLAKLYQSTGRLADAHAVLAHALEGFAPTPEMPKIAEAQALLAALAETEEVKAEGAKREGRLRLQTAYGQAMTYSKGFAAAETKSAFARATELAAAVGIDDFSARFAAFDGECRSAIVRGELQSAWELASSFLREAEDAARIAEGRAARRSLGLVAYFRGDFVDARAHLERALEICDVDHQEAPPVRFGDDIGAIAASYLALASWQLGEVERARDLIDAANKRADEIGHVTSRAIPLYWKSYLEILRGDPSAALNAAEALAAVAQAHAMTHFSNMAELNKAWAHGRLHDPTVGAAQFRRALKAHLDNGFRIGAGFYTGLLAELEAEVLGADRALERIDEALSLARQVDYQCDIAFFHRMGGDILLKRDPSNPAPAEEAYKTAIAAAKEHGARSPVLQASLSLAKLYQSSAAPPTPTPSLP